MPVKLSPRTRVKNNYFLLQDEAFIGEPIYIQTHLNKKQICEAVAYISLILDDIISDDSCKPKLVAIFLNKYFFCDLFESLSVVPTKIDVIDILQEKFKRISFAYHFITEYAQKNDAHRVKDGVYEHIASVLSFKRYLS